MADIKWSQFPQAAGINSTDSLVGLQNNDNTRFSFATILAWVRQQISSFFVPKTDVGAAGGVASLDSNGKVPGTQLDLSGKQDKITASGILKGDGAGGVSAAVAGTDYQAPLTAGTDYATPTQLEGKANPGQIGYPETGTTASRNYSAGEYICWNGLTYTADTNIALGATLSASGGNKNLTECVGGGLNEALFVDIPYNSFEWFTGLPAFRALYTVPTGYYIAAINVFFTNGSALAGPRYSSGYIYIIGLNGRGQAIDNTYEFVCTVMLRRT